MGTDKEAKESKDSQDMKLNVKLGIGASVIGIFLAAASIYLYARDAFRAASKTAASAIAPASAANCHCRLLPSVTATFCVNAFHMIVLCIWIFVPPVWFASETYITDRHYQDAHLKQSQEMFARVWVAVSVMLGVLASASK
jgi:hypothetical protein